LPKLIVCSNMPVALAAALPPLMLLLPLLLCRCCLQGEADATWVFMGWEGVEAASKGVELNAFK